MFNKQKILTRGIVIHCPKESQAIALCNYLHSIGRRWGYRTYLETTHWQDCKENMCYHPRGNEYSSLQYFRENSQKYTVISFEEAFISHIFTHKSKAIKLTQEPSSGS